MLLANVLMKARSIVCVTYGEFLNCLLNELVLSLVLLKIFVLIIFFFWRGGGGGTTYMYFFNFSTYVCKSSFFVFFITKKQFKSYVTVK